MNHSNLTFRPLEDLKAYEERNLQGTDLLPTSACPIRPFPPTSRWTLWMPSSP